MNEKRLRVKSYKELRDMKNVYNKPLGVSGRLVPKKQMQAILDGKEVWFDYNCVSLIFCDIVEVKTTLKQLFLSKEALL